MGKKAQARRKAKMATRPERPAAQQPASQMIQVSDATFEQQVLRHEGLVLVDFWAPWCGPCKMIGPVLEELSKTMGDKIKFTKLNTEANRAVPSRYNIRSIPTLILFRDGEVADVKIGAVPRPALERWLERAANPKSGLMSRIFG